MVIGYKVRGQLFYLRIEQGRNDIITLLLWLCSALLLCNQNKKWCKLITLFKMYLLYRSGRWPKDHTCKITAVDHRPRTHSTSALREEWFCSNSQVQPWRCNTFGHHQVCYPVVSACSKTTELPVRHMRSYDQFKEVLKEAFLLGQEFRNV